MGGSEHESGATRRSSITAMVSTDGERPARASKTASREASRGLVADETTTAGSRTTIKTSLSRVASPALSAKANTTSVGESAHSEPMTRLPSTSSQVSSKEPPVPVSSSYGTRSRNRRGGDRPNYAEDTEMDFEMANQAAARPRNSEYLSDNSSNEEPLSPLSPVPFGLPQSPPPAPAPPKRAAATNGWNALNKEASVPSTSVATAAPTVPAPSRKRKAAAIASQNIASGNPSVPTAAQMGSKKGGLAALPTPPSRETNMVTFENCNTTLNKDGHLVSDEGVVYAPNGNKILIEADGLLKATVVRQDPTNTTYRSHLSHLRAARRSVLYWTNYGISLSSSRGHNHTRRVHTDQLGLPTSRCSTIR